MADKVYFLPVTHHFVLEVSEDNKGLCCSIRCFISVVAHHHQPTTVYSAPIILQVIRKEKPDGILISMGGQTALNVGLSLHRAGDLEAHGVKILGTPPSAIEVTEDREAFANMLAGE